MASTLAAVNIDRAGRGGRRGGAIDERPEFNMKLQAAAERAAQRSPSPPSPREAGNQTRRRQQRSELTPAFTTRHSPARPPSAYTACQP